MKKKKILIVHHSGLLGGAGISLYHTWLELNKHYEVSCYIPDDPDELWDFFQKKGLNPKTFDYRLAKLTYYSGGNSMLNPKFWYHSLRLLFHRKIWSKIIEQEKPDLIIVNSIVLCWFGLITKKYKTLCFVRETIRGNRNNLPNMIMESLLEKFSLVSFLSDFDKKTWNLKKAESNVSYNFMESKSYTRKLSKQESCNELRLNPHSFNILFIGGFNRIKGTDIVIDAMSELSDLNINLLIAGNNPGKFSFGSLSQVIQSLVHFRSKWYYKTLQERMSLGNNEISIYYLGIQKDIRQVFDASDLLIIPMTEPHQARPVFEFGSQAKPVVVSDFKNIREFVEDNVNGLVFEPGNSRDLADKIRILEQNKDLYRILGENNYNNSVNRHELDIVVKGLVDRINTIV